MNRPLENRLGNKSTTHGFICAVALLLTLSASRGVSPAHAEEEPIPAEAADDLDILKAIVRRTLLEVWAPGDHADWQRWLHGWLPGPGHDSIGPAHAVLLRGYGVVLQVAAPRVLERRFQRDAGTETPVALSEWERTKRLLRGEPTPGKAMPSNCSTCHQVSPNATWPTVPLEPPTRQAVVSALLRTMEENGHNLGSLGADEKLSIVVDFTRELHTGSRAGSGESAQGLLGYLLEALSPHGHAATPLREASSGAFFSPRREGTSENPSDSAELKADLYLRHGDLSRAAKAYEQLLEKTGESTPEPKRQAFVRKLIMSYVGMGRYDEALRLMQELRTRSDTPSQALETVRGQLVLTARKQDLDGVASGELSSSDFRSRVSIEFRRLPERPTATATPSGSKETGSLRGRVEAVNEEDGLVVLSIGRDQGVTVGRRFHVVRENLTIAELEVVKVYADLCGARVLHSDREREIRVGDAVVGILQTPSGSGRRR